MNIPILYRILILAVTLITVYTLPWWIPIPVAFLGILIFHLYELVIIGVLLDALYPHELFSFLGTGFFFTTLLLVAVSASWIFTRKLRIVNS